MNTKLVLGSASIGRKKVLKNAGFDFEVMAGNIDEKAIRNVNVEKMVTALARAKADFLLPKIQGKAVLITADQVTVFQGTVREKPKDTQQAYEFLKSYNMENPVMLIGALVVTNTKNSKRAEGIHLSKVLFSKMPDDVITTHIKNGCLRAAGGFMIEYPELQPYIKKIEGGQDAVMGLSVSLFEKLLREVQT